MEVSTGVETLKRLSKNGLVKDTQDPVDKRSKRLKLTPKGMRAVTQALARFTELDHW
ncbi:MAG: MarR family transcriptional regulator [Bacteroidales bacterium]|nr:MarR family transcriptional regulator [Bacteroidales bacterium]